MANRYWVGGTGTWNTTSTTNWSASDGGASGASVPTSADSVFFTDSSGLTGASVITLSGNINCLGFNFTASANCSFTATSFALGCNASFTLTNASVNFSAIGTINSTGSLVRGFNSACNISNVTVGFVTGGSVTLQSNINCNAVVFNVPVDFAGYFISAIGQATISSVPTSIDLRSGTTVVSVAGTYNFTSGSIRTNGFTLSSGTFVYGSTASLLALDGINFLPSFTHTAGTFTLNKDLALSSTSTYTLTAGTLTLGGNLTTGIFSSNNTNIRSIAFGIYNITLNHTTAAQTILNVPSGTNFTWTGTGGFITDASVTRTINVGSVNSGSLLGFNVTYTGTGNQTQTLTNSDFNTLDFGTTTCSVTTGLITVANLIFSASGTYTGVAVRLGDQHDGAGVKTFITNGKTVSSLQVTGTATTTFTFTGSLGTSTYTQTSGNVDFAGFNLTCSSTVSYTAGTLSNIGTITCTTWTITGTFNFTSGTITPSTSFVLTSGAFNYSGGTLSAVPTFTHTAGTVTLGNSYALTSSGTYTFSSGNLNLGNYTLTTGSFSSGGSTARTVDFSTSSLIQLTGNNATIWEGGSVGFTITGTMQVVSTYSGSTGTRTVNVGIGWTQATDFDVKCNACVGIQINSGATDTVVIAGVVKDLDLTGLTCTFSPGVMTVYGDYTIPASGGTVSATANLTTFASTNATVRTITISRSIDFPITFNGVGGTFQLGASLTNGTTRTVTLLNGTFNLNNYNLTTGLFVSNNSNTRALDFGSGSITVNGIGTPWDTTITTGLTVTGSKTVNVTTAGTSTITVIPGVITESNAFDFNITGTTTINFLTVGSHATRNVDFTGFTGTIAATAAVTIYGNYTLSAGMTVTASASIMTFGATSGTKTITTNGKTMPRVVINGVGGTFNLGSSLTISGSLQVTAGTFDTTASNFNITCTSIDSITTSSERAISLNGSTVTVSGTAGVTLNDVNLTFSCGTSQLTLSNATSTVLSVIGSATFRDVSFTGGAPTITLVGTNTYNNLTFTNGASAIPSVVTITGNQTVGGTLSNSSTNVYTRLRLQSSTSGSQIILSAETESLTDVDFKDIDASGAAIPFVGTRFGDLGNNTDITFDAARTLYWNLVAGGNWNATAWATTSGGTPDINNFPLAQDTCIIENTGLNTSATITMNANWTFGTLNMSTRTNAMTLAIGTTTPTVTGNWTNGTGTTLTGTGTVNFKNTGTTQTITASGITFTPNISYESDGGTLQLATALTLGATSTFTLIKGTLSLNGFTLTTGIFSSNNSFTRSIAFGTTNIILAHTTAATNVLDMANLSNFSTTGTGQFTSAMGVTRTFTSGTLSAVTGSLAFNGTSQYAIISYGQGGTNWAGTLAISSTFTVESWIYLTAAPTTYGTIAALWSAAGNSGQSYALAVNSSRQLTAQYGGFAGTFNSFSGGTIPLNAWTHVAWVGSGGNQYLYVNGVLVATAGTPLTYSAQPHDFYIGARLSYIVTTNIEQYFSGNISNLRIVNGVRVYTGNFTPSVSPLNPTQSSGTNISAITAGQTELLLNTPNNASILADGSINNFILTNAGATTSASTPITSLPAAGTPPSLSLTSGAAIPTFASGSYFTNLNFTGTTSVPAVSTITVNGNLTLATGGTYTSLGVTMAGTGTITPLAKTIAAFVVNTSGTATLAAAFGCTTFTMTAGTLNLASFNLTCSSTATYTAGTLSNIATITCTTWTTQGTFAHSQGTITPSTSFVITSGSYTQTGTSVLSAVPTFTQTAGNVTFRSTYALTATGTYTLTAGALTLGGDLTTGIFSSTGTGTRSIAFSTFNIVLAHTTAAQTVLSMATLTNFTWTGTGGFTSAMSVTRTFQSGSTAGGSSTTVPNLSLISGASIPTLTSGSSFNNLNFTGSTSAPASATVSVYGNLTLASGGSYTTFTVNMVGSAGNINGAGTSSLLGLVINNGGGTTTLTAALTLTATGTTTLTSGNLNLNGFTLSTGIFSSDNTNTRSITFGVSNIVLTHTTAATVVLSMATVTGFTYTSSGTYGSGTGCFQATMSATRTFRFGNTAGGSATNSPRLYLASGASIATLTTASWFSELDFGTTAFTIAATNLNLNSFKSNSSTSVLTNLTATMVGTGTIKTNTSIGALIINSTSGTTTLDSSTATILRCTSCSILSGTLDINNQTLASTGVVSFSGGSLTNISSITCTSFQVTGATFDFTSGTITPSTSFVITSGSFTYSGTASLSAVATFTHTNGTVTFSKNYSLTATGTYTFTAGSLVLGDGLALTTGIFSSSGTGTRSIAFGNITAGNISLAHTTAGQIVLAMADITNFSSTGPGGFISVMGVTRTFTCGTTGGSVSSAPNLTLNTGSQIGTISTGSWFRNLIFDATTFTVPATVLNITESISLSAASSTFTSLSVTMRGTGTITPNGKAIAAFTVNTSGTATLAAALSCTSYVQTAGTTDFGTFNLTSSGTGLFTSGTLTNVGLITCTTFTVAGVFAHTDGTITPSTSFVTTSGSYTQTGTSVLSAVPTFTQTAGDVTFRSTYALTATGTYTLTAGALTLGGNLTVGIFSSTGTGTRSIAFSTFNIVLTHTTAGTTVLSMADITNFTPSGTGAFTTAMSVTRSFSIGSTTGGSITTAPNLSLTSGASIPTFTSGSWINNLDFTGSTCTPATSTLNIESLTLASGGTYTNLSINAIGTGTITPNGKTIVAFVVNNGAGTTTLAGALNCSTYTQTSGNIDFASFNLTCSSTGFFSSGTLSNIGTISCTTFTVAGIFTHTDGTITPSTSFVTTSGSYTQTGTSVLSTVPTFTQTAGDVTFRSAYSLSTLTGTYTLSAGALTLGGNLTVGIFSSTNTNTRSIAFGSSNIVLTHTTAATKVLNASDITNFSCTGTGGFESAMGVTRTFDVCTVGSGSNFGSLSFNGTSRYLSVPSNTAFAFGSGDFTIEFWLYVLTFPTNPAIAQLFDNRPASTQGAYPLIYLNFNGTIRFWVNSADRITSSAIPSDTWNHIAISRSGTTTKMFINGTQSGSSYTDTTSYLTSTVRIGAGYSGGASIINFLNGYISNYRVVKGLAVYTGNFTVPKVVLESTQEAGVNINAITGTETSLLLKTPNTNSFLTDSSVNNFTITNTGSVTSSTLTPLPVTGLYQARINGSVSFNGIDQLLSIPSNSVFSFGTGDFTIEHWVYSTSFATQAATISLFSNNSGSYITGQCQIVVNTNGTISFSYATGLSTTVDLTTSTTITTNAWYHIAVVRSGSGSGNLKIYINGTVAATSAGAVTQAIGTTGAGRIGLNGNSAGNFIFTGYLSNMRIVKGNAVYTANFTVPFRVLTTSQTANTNGNPSSAITGSETSLLLDTYYGGNFLRDASFYSINITASGAPSSTVAPIPNNGSISFNGTSQYLMSPTDAALAMGTGDFTVECWWYQSVNNADRGFLSSIAASVGTSGYGFQLCGNGAFTGGNSIGTYDTFAWTLPLNQWNHVALVRISGICYAYVNGILASSGATTLGNNLQNSSVAVGTSYTNNFTFKATGYISNVRLVKGVAVYTSNFTVPSSPFTAVQSTNVNGNPSAAITSGQTSLLLNTYYASSISSTTDGSINNFTITNNGAAVSSIDAPPLPLASSADSTPLPPSLFLNSGSSVPTFTNNSWFKDLVFTGSSTTPATATVLITKDLTLSTGGTYTGLTVIAAGTGNYTSAGKTIPYFYIDANGGTATLADDLNVSDSITLISGTFNLSSYNTTSVSFFSNGTSTRSITGSGTYSLTGSGSTTFYNINAAGITMSGVTVNMTSASAKTFAGGGGSYPILNQGGAGALTISGNNSFTDITATTRPSTISFTAGSTQTVTGFTLSGTLGNLVTINSTTPGTQFNLSRASGTVSVGYLNIQDSNATGGAGWYADVTSFNVSNNTGWIFTAPPGGVYLGNFFAFF